MLQFEALETACVQYLASQMLDMTEEMLLCLAKLGDHLGLSAMVDDAVDDLIQQPWVDNIDRIAHILVMPMFQHDTAKTDRLLHHSKRGAYTELQVLDLLEMVDAPETNIVSGVKLETMHYAELDTLLGILKNTEHSPGMLLYKAVQQYRLPEGSRPAPDWSTCTRIFHNILMPDTREYVNIPVAQTNLYLAMYNTQTQKDGKEMQQ